MRSQLDIFDHDPARMAAANRAAAYVGEAERWEHLAAHSARSTSSKDMQA
ncbi:hypothetical protein ACMGRF_13745 [Stenotrophomonas sp. EMP41]